MMRLIYAVMLIDEFQTYPSYFGNLLHGVQNV